MTECNGQPVAKVSDAPGKTVSTDPGYLAYLRQVYGLEPAQH
jgi:nicotinate phosphoribosyltransferase